ncbi:DUF1471 domain-containing protein [Budviciaceae bacterium CWB-B4]|uniref:DUF1471 domain-containing protein n=1 Tax=Limnobaculum xujianqingii TaxID=2738837 RepID=A0A9D7AKT4_9GAMM|nr:DUF1471 domain-containing protein [Limnobaculum xujianqingii]MBK5074517.1 DUF1471 domain-containing protein [Limnobaculum xujianqingii]MBK5177817.1 DUF1471 domain-containing protein [Limnobaculum xujianqingii]
MKVSSILTAAFLALSLNSAYAITEIINTQQAEKMNLTSLGVISDTVRVETLDQAVQAIGEKAEKAGATYFRVIGARSFDTSPYWRVSAEIYK